MKLFRLGERNDRGLKPLQVRSYRDPDLKHPLGHGEELLQRLLVRDPGLIPSDEIDPDDPPRFTTIKAEAEVTSGSIDVLLLDHNGVPTVVEAKLVDNREIRRAVLAQGLEYLAHLSDWTPDRFFGAAREFRQRTADLHDQPLTPDDEVRLLPLLAENLRANRLRLIIAADRVPLELRRMIEFLSEASAFDVYGLEVQLMSEPGETDLLLTAHLIGTSERARRKSTPTPRSKWDEETFVRKINTERSPAEVEVALDLLEFSRNLPEQAITWGTGVVSGSFSAGFRIGSQRFHLFTVDTNADCLIHLGWNRERLDNVAPTMSEEYRQRVENLFGLNIPTDLWKRGSPRVTLDAVKGHLAAFKQLVDEFVQAVREVHARDG